METRKRLTGFSGLNVCIWERVTTVNRFAGLLNIAEYSLACLCGHAGGKCIAPDIDGPVRLIRSGQGTCLEPTSREGTII